MILYSQQGNYVRKSISSPQTVLISTSSIKNLDFDYKSFERFLNFYIEVPRFDQNKLPEKVLRNFKKKAMLINNYDAINISRLLRKTIISEILEILNDPDIQKSRLKNFRNESQFYSFADTKGKSLNLNSEELKSMMNSAYIYIPYISSARSYTNRQRIVTQDTIIKYRKGVKIEKVEYDTSEIVNKYSVEINGGIIWYRLNIDENGKTKINMIKNITASSSSQYNPTDYNSKKKYRRFYFGNDSWRTSPEQYIQNDAMLSFCKELGLKTKKIEDFQLTAQIIEANKRTYGIDIGKAEGLNLDDGFYIYDLEEDINGNEIEQKIGYARVIKTGNNLENPNDLSYIKQIMGPIVAEGSYIREHSKLGLSFDIQIGRSSDIWIKPKHTSLTFADIDQNIIEKDVKNISTFAIGLSYNIAAIINLTQSYIKLEFGLGFPHGQKISDDFGYGKMYILSPYLNLKKRFGSRLFNGIQLGAGFDNLYISDSTEIYDYAFNIFSTNFKIENEIGFYINPELVIIFSSHYKTNIYPLSVNLNLHNKNYKNNNSYLFNDFYLGGISINIGMIYEIKNIGTNIFGRLDPFKVY